MVNKEELYSKLNCALSHDLDTCNKCKKCGKDAGIIRLKLVEELADYMGLCYPWEDIDEDIIDD